jgi:hypothetical protein
VNAQPAYQYDFAGLYAGETVADESPLEPGIYLIPAGCTLTPPPADIPDDKWPRWNGATWDLVSRPTPANDDDGDAAVAKLRQFLAANPDVAALLNNDGGANV